MYLYARFISTSTMATNSFSDEEQCHHHGTDFDDMLSFFPCEIDDAIQYINLGCGAQAPKIVTLKCIFLLFCLVLKF